MGRLQSLPKTILPSNSDVVEYYLFKKETTNASNSMLIKDISEELIDIYKSIHIPSLELKNVKVIIQRLVDRSSKKTSKKSIKNSNVQGFLNGPDDCCIITKCRCFLKTKSKDEIGKFI